MNIFYLSDCPVEAARSQCDKQEYTHRYGKIHASQATIEWCADNVPDIPDAEMTKMPQCMPDEFKDYCSIVAYRKLYNIGKRESFKCVWTNREEPIWWKNYAPDAVVT